MLIDILPVKDKQNLKELLPNVEIPELKIHFPGKVVFGNDSLKYLPDELLQLSASRVFILTIAPLLPQIQDCTAKLKDLGVEVYTDTSIIKEPYFSDFDSIMKKVELLHPDVVVGIGGGSVLDVAKLIAAQLENEQSLQEYVGINLLKSRKKKLVCIPATSGTGSEVSPNAILVDDLDNQKKGIISPYLVPDMVLVDPLLTISMPPDITAATGLDALTHCLEAYTNKFAHPLIDVYAFEGMRQIVANLELAVKEGSNKDARAAVAMGSLLGGFCLGPVNTAGVHALSYPLGSNFHLPHGLSNAILLPYVMEFNLPSAISRYAQVAIALGCCREESEEATAYKGIERIKRLIEACGIPARLRDVGVPEQAIPEMATAALKITRLLKNNPRTITIEDAIGIYQAAY
ncbi:iron-containing alcohol dehydrogenase [Chitinophagaceae bacterium LB-8]|uniref:Iron-containing alcohol dehydrogenase n=1 Tax=Paraflavisolibacter caeni TaxID=2982496 RepID=A0A9X2XYU6_9BACT|nr:iron-containing alcohol dehydrogenase [Paraflavisolibacter caeni]MCU7551891.1 iron-containing alcohol dehydrogenase [Paraflavisolibacter caeni]